MARLTNESFIQKAKVVHGDKYDYSKVDYRRTNQPVEIICKKHGSYFQTPNCHLQGANCPKCALSSRGHKNKLIIRTKYTCSGSLQSRLDAIEPNTYFIKDYSEYTNHTTKLTVVCRRHGEEERTPRSILRGVACSICDKEKKQKEKLTTFIKKSAIVHNNFYSYEKAVYTEPHTKITITCPKHGDFLQTPASHVRGVGCPVCSSSKGELKIFYWLMKNKINFKQQYKVSGCKNILDLPFDFAIFKNQNLKLLIEFDGIQHFQEIERFGGPEGFEKIKHNDYLKTSFCKKHNIKLLRIPYNKRGSIEKILAYEIGSL